jgi:putative ABC transport system ATP-binding protein
MKLLTRSAREQGTTVVLVTHEPRVAAYADREIIVRDGKVSVATPSAPASAIMGSAAGGRGTGSSE